MSTEEPKKIFYAGCLPVFKGVRYHPQFRHLNKPPSGYKFLINIEDNSKQSIFLNLIYLLILLVVGEKWYLKIFQKAWQLGIFKTIIIWLKFIKSKDVCSQLKISHNTKLAFVPSFPHILGQCPWMIEIEDTTTLLVPFIKNGKTSDVKIHEHPGFYIVKALLESESCRGIICHIKSTAESIPILFQNHKLSNKVFHIPLGVDLPSTSNRKNKKDNYKINILFTNSWGQHSWSFYLRGGIDILEAFSILSSKYTELQLVIRSKLPEDLDNRYQKIVEGDRVQVIDQFLPKEQLEMLFYEADIYALPAARIHVVSILSAMAHGIPVVVSDGWGIEEYVEHGWNGLVVSGRYGKCSWIDEQGILREDYSSLWKSDPEVVTRLVAAFSELIDNPEKRKRIGENARKDVENKFSIENWNSELKKAFDIALSG